MEDAPYRAEYAKSSRAGCKLCKGSITKDSLRVAKMVQVRSDMRRIAGGIWIGVCLTWSHPAVSVLRWQAAQLVPL